MSSGADAVDTNNGDVAADARAARLFRHTPLIHSATLTEHCQRPVYLKLDCLQASGSFKDRGMAHLCWTVQQTEGVQKLIASSGGNAGLAAATVARELGLTCQVVIPETTKPLVIAKLRKLGADVHIHGENWNAADTLARQWVKDDSSAYYISPYDHPLLWTGHSTLIDEIVHDLQRMEQPPTGIDNNNNTQPPQNVIGTLIVSVGGGGLLCGALEGLERHAAAKSSSGKTTTTRVIAAETTGASSFGQAWKRGELVRLPSIDSIATSLGALEVTPVALERANRLKVEHDIATHSALCTDAEAVEACLQLARDHRLLVEPACGAALAVAYSERLRQEYLLGDDKNPLPEGPIVIEVCGGSGVNLELLSQWKSEFDL